MKTILVVDDNQNIGLLYKEELEDDGYQVTVTATGKELSLIHISEPTRPY